jgi:hypothetical protein
MEMMLDMLSSNIFIIFVILVVLFNIMRRRNKRIHTRTARRQNQLKNRIRVRQAELWDNPQEDAPAREQKDSEQKS